ncbi:NTPase [Vaccinia virus]|uniref:Uncoating factor OPG117 n=2 Tax=Vaccinia virus TaxID=10245 RepID=O93119_VACCA|nr:putative 90.4k protein [Vaccinia virus]QOS44630.1 MVA102R [synthetic construct]AAT10500.1 NTPase [Vaccinia virus]AUO38409.1 NTPase [Vaccinia virus]QCI57128.1 NTPase [Vaccinia virus]
MDATIRGNDVIFVLKTIGVPSACRQNEDPRFVEAFKCDELERYIENNPECTLFESLRDEEAYSIVRIFMDVDLDACLDEIDYLTAIQDFIIEVSNCVARFAFTECGAIHENVIKSMRSNFSLTKSTNRDKTSFHIIFLDTYTTMDTLIAMKRTLLELSRSSENPLTRSIDTAVYRRKTTLRVVGTRKNPNCDTIHVMQPPHDNIEDYLFTYVDMNNNSYYFSLQRRLEDLVPDKLWEPGFISFEDAIKRVSKIFINSIINFNDLDENNFTTVPLVIDYVTPCALCKKRSHKHPHQLSLENGAIRIYKTGNPHSCKVKIVPLDGNKLFNIAQRILDTNSVLLTERGDHIVWINNSWKFNSEEPLITKLILSIRHQLPKEYSSELLCPRKRKTVEANIRDMLIDSVETDTYPDKLPFKNGVLDLVDGMFYSGDDAKKYTCTVSTGFKFDDTKFVEDSPEMEELMNIINDIQPLTDENKKNRELYEKTLSSCLCGATKGCLTFFFGETATGKSTTKRLLKSAIGDLFVETGQTILTDVLDKGPNPFIANMHLKRSVFCSELPDFACSGSKKIRSDNIKKLTEPCVIGRPCFSNKINNRNHATIIIDTNYKPVFDRIDNALMRRIAVVRFRTHFSQPSGREAAENNDAYDKVKLLDEGLDGKIQNNRYRFAFLYLLVKWYKKYHVPIMKLYPTPEEIPDFAFYLKIGTLLVSSSVKHIPLMTDLSKKGYILYDNVVTLPLTTFQQKISKYFNSRLFGHDIESFINRHKKFANVSDEYLQYIFIEDISSP